MKTSDLINRLTELIDAHGDLEVIITDGFEQRCYRTNEEYPQYDVQYFDHDGEEFIDIGIGGTFEEPFHQ